MPQLQCPFCDRSNPSDSHYCNNCGQRLQLKICPQCEVVNGEIAETCYQCGAPLPATAGSDAAQAACARLREILSAGALPPAVDGATSASAISTDAQPGVAQAGAPQPGEREHQPPDREPAILRGRFDTDHALFFPVGSDGPLAQDFDLSRLADAGFRRESGPLASEPPVNELDGAAARAASPPQSSEAAPMDLQLPSNALSAAQRYKPPRRKLAILVGAFAFAVVVVAGSMYYAREPSRDSLGAIPQPRSPAAEAANADVPRASSISQQGQIAQPMPEGSASSVDAVRSLGMAAPAETANPAVPAPATPTVRAAARSDRVERAAGQSDSTAGRSRDPRKASAAAVSTAAKQADVKTVPAKIDPPACTEGVAALGLCTPASQEETNK